MRKVTPIREKVKHVKAAPDPGDHDCHWPGCTAKVKPAMFMCSRHWFALPRELRFKIWNKYEPGQEVTKTPSAEYLTAAKEIFDWIRENVK